MKPFPEYTSAKMGLLMMAKVRFDNDEQYFCKTISGGPNGLLGIRNMCTANLIGI